MDVMDLPARLNFYPFPHEERADYIIRSSTWNLLFPVC